jgi:hypothetical protein
MIQGVENSHLVQLLFTKMSTGLSAFGIIHLLNQTTSILDLLLCTALIFERALSLDICFQHRSIKMLTYHKVFRENSMLSLFTMCFRLREPSKQGKQEELIFLKGKESFD